MSDQVATKLRRDGLFAQSISLWIGYSLTYVYEEGKTGFSKQIKVPSTNNTKTIADHLIQLFRNYYYGQVVRNIGVNTSKLTRNGNQQLNLFDDVYTLEKENDLDKVVDEIREKFGFTKLIYMSSN